LLSEGKGKDRFFVGKLIFGANAILEKSERINSISMDSAPTTVLSDNISLKN
jgi:hypothetical protein